MPALDTSRIAPHLSDDALGAAMPRALEMLRSLLAREGPGAGMLGWLDLPLAPRSETERIIDAAKRVQDENDCLVVVGIGGSYLGAKAAIEALPAGRAFPVVFAGTSLSPEHHERVLADLEGKRFALCVISKSGTTLESAIAARLFRERLLATCDANAARGRIIAITDPSSGALRRLAESEGYASFPIPRDVGGRFSVLSAVGLFPCAAGGIPIGEMIEGARSSLAEHARLDDGNAAVRYAAVRHLLYERGTRIEVLSTFHPELAFFCEWWKQLAGESEGKGGKGLFPASTVMTTDLHSLGQYLQDGERIILETFLVAAGHRSRLAVPRDERNEDGLGYLAGREIGAVNRSAFEGTRDAHASGGLPVLTVSEPSISAHSIGALFFFFEVAIAISARLLGVNPFDQPGVEEYKRRMCGLLGEPEKR